jgi:drug/metabolite transporter (DMT)-like permease
MHTCTVARALWHAAVSRLARTLYVLALGVLCTGTAYVLFFKLIATIGPARALTVTFMVPVFATLAGVLFLKEVVSLWTLPCAIVIICGTALSSDLIRLRQ